MKDETIINLPRAFLVGQQKRDKKDKEETKKGEKDKKEEENN